MSFEDDQYDEFGNYIGPEALEESPSFLGYDDEQAEDRNVPDSLENGLDMESENPELSDVRNIQALVRMNMMDQTTSSTQIVLHEDKKYYPSASVVYGQHVETMVEEEDTQPLTQPIIAPVTVKKIALEEKPVIVNGESLPVTYYRKEFLLELMNHPSRIRNIAICGHLKHGKSSLVDMLVRQTHPHSATWKESNEKPERYTDSRLLEREREMSLVCTPMSMVLQTSSSTSYLLNIMDTPGHVQFLDEVEAGVALCDGMILVIDVVEGILKGTENALKLAVQGQLPIVLVLNKLDRLILELRLPITDAYYKMKCIIDELNTMLRGMGYSQELFLAPELGNVLFSSASYDWIFSIPSFATLYSESYPGVDVETLTKRLWGDIYYDRKSNAFATKKSSSSSRTFESFILEPLYKLHTTVIAEEVSVLEKLLADLNITELPRSKLDSMDSKPLLRQVLQMFLNGSGVTALTDSVVRDIPDPSKHSAKKVAQFYTGPLDSLLGQNICSKTSIAEISDAPLMIHVSKLLPLLDGSGFTALGRIYSGKIQKGLHVNVLGEHYTPQDQEDRAANILVTGISVPCSRYSIPISDDWVSAGNWICIDGLDASITKFATITNVQKQNESSTDEYSPWPFSSPLSITTTAASIVKLSIEPRIPSELPKMLEGLRKISRAYPSVTNKVEESGELVLMAPGELPLDCILYDLGHSFTSASANTETLAWRLSEPSVQLCETVTELSSLPCFASSINQRNSISMLAQPVEKKVAIDLASGKFAREWSLGGSSFVNYVQEHYNPSYGDNWDTLAARSIWAIGPDIAGGGAIGGNLFCDDTLSFETDKQILSTCKSSFIQGFQWAVRQGPLLEEPIRQVRFRLTDAKLAKEPIYRGGGQLIPLTRRVVYGSFLLASPRLMEPIYHVEVLTKAEHVSTVYALFAKRRGHVTQETPRAGTPFTLLRGLLPVMDSFGFETDLRMAAFGQCSISCSFDSFQQVPGDPLDESLQILPLEPSPAPALARDYLLKTRRRKGLPEQVHIETFLDDSMIQQLQQHDQADEAQMNQENYS